MLTQKYKTYKSQGENASINVSTDKMQNKKQKPKLPPHLKIDSRQGTFSLGEVDTCCKAFGNAILGVKRCPSLLVHPCL